MDKYLTKALILNLTYKNYTLLCIMENKEPLSETTFRTKINFLHSIVVNHYKKELNKTIEGVRDKSVIISFDTRWSSRGYCANESTTSFFLFNEQSKEYTLLYTFNCMKRGKFANYKGSSKSMETFGTEKIIKKLKKRNVKVITYIHDADAATAAILRKFFPESNEKIDKLHKVRSIKRRIYGLQEKTLKKRDWVERILKCASIMLYSHIDDIKGKEEHLSKKLKHWEGNHLECGTQCEITYKTLTANQVSAVSTILKSIIEEHSKLNHSYHTNANESFNSSIISFCPKNITQPSVYPYKIARAGLVSLFKTESDKIIFNLMQLEANERLAVSISRIEKRRKYVINYQKSATYKENRRKRLLAKRKLSLISNNDKSYGTVLSFCYCQGGKSLECCSTRRCKCNQTGVSCNEKCKCKSKCKNQITS